MKVSKLFFEKVSKLVFLKKINLLIHINNTIDRNTKSKVLKTLEDEEASMLIAKRIYPRLTHLIIQQCLKHLRFKICSILMNKI